MQRPRKSLPAFRRHLLSKMIFPVLEPIRKKQLQRIRLIFKIISGSFLKFNIFHERITIKLTLVYLKKLSFAESAHALQIPLNIPSHKPSIPLYICPRYSISNRQQSRSNLRMAPSISHNPLHIVRNIHRPHCPVQTRHRYTRPTTGTRDKAVGFDHTILVRIKRHGPIAVAPIDVDILVRRCEREAFFSDFGLDARMLALAFGVVEVSDRGPAFSLFERVRRCGGVGRGGHSGGRKSFG